MLSPFNKIRPVDQFQLRIRSSLSLFHTTTLSSSSTSVLEFPLFLHEHITGLPTNTKSSQRRRPLIHYTDHLPRSCLAFVSLPDFSMYTSSASSSTRFMNSSKPCWRKARPRVGGRPGTRWKVHDYSGRARSRLSGVVQYQKDARGHELSRLDD